MELNFVNVERGKLAIGHRPKIKDILQLKNEGVSTIVTILGENENPFKIIRETQKQGLKSIHIPIGNAKLIKEPKEIHNVIAYLYRIKDSLLHEENVYIHCSAGIHRTGMYTSALLMLCGYTSDETFDILGELREVTQANVGEDRFKWGERALKIFEEGA